MKIEVYEIITLILDKKDELIKFFDLCSKDYVFDDKSKIFYEDLVNGNLQKVDEVLSDYMLQVPLSDFEIKISAINYEYDIKQALKESIPLDSFNAKIAFDNLKPAEQNREYLIAVSLFVDSSLKEIIWSLK